MESFTNDQHMTSRPIRGPQLSLGFETLLWDDKPDPYDLASTESQSGSRPEGMKEAAQGVRGRSVFTAGSIWEKRLIRGHETVERVSWRPGTKHTVRSVEMTAHLGTLPVVHHDSAVSRSYGPRWVRGGGRPVSRLFAKWSSPVCPRPVGPQPQPRRTSSKRPVASPAATQQILQ